MKNQDHSIKTYNTVAIAERQTPPVLTAMLALLLILVYFSYQSAHGPTWITRNTFQMEQIINLVNTQKYGQILSMIFMTNFADVNVWELLISVYFVFLFGIPVEKRLGPSRFILLMLLACTLPWVVQFLDLYYCPLWPIPFEHPKQNLFFFGPLCIILALAGAYNVLMPKKMPDLSKSRFHRKERTEIFNRAESKAMNAGFGFAPQLFFIVFIIMAFASHYIFSYFFKNYDTIGLYAGFVALASGFLTAGLIHMGMEDSYQDHPLKREAIKHYYELLDLDVGHDNAVKGSAKGLGLPDYQVEDWVKKTKGKLRPS